MAERDIIVIGASAGGIEVLQEVMAGLPADLAATVLIVVHMPPSGGHALSRIVGNATTLSTSGRPGTVTRSSTEWSTPPGATTISWSGRIRYTSGAARGRTDTGRPSTRCSAVPRHITVPGSSGWFCRAA